MCNPRNGIANNFLEKISCPKSVRIQLESVIGVEAGQRKPMTTLKVVRGVKMICCVNRLNGWSVDFIMGQESCTLFK